MFALLLCALALLVAACSFTWDDSANSGTNVRWKAGPCAGQDEALPVGGSRTPANATTVGGGG
jgi:hypothetical protein